MRADARISREPYKNTEAFRKEADAMIARIRTAIPGAKIGENEPFGEIGWGFMMHTARGYTALAYDAIMGGIRHQYMLGDASIDEIIAGIG